MTNSVVLSVRPLGFPWETADPFLFCVHHDDSYPAGNQRLGPASSLAGRNIGMDFEGKDGWSMYHGDVVPGFPQHPHRGFETVTLVRKGLIDHSDSLGATARFGGGDVQWMTAGRGVVHSEMFPLLNQKGTNPLELFQIWLNLPRADKMVEPHFSMLWSHTLPRVRVADSQGRLTELSVVAGRLGDAAPPSPPPKSWGSRPEADLAIWTVKMSPGAHWTMPPAKAGTDRTLSFFRGRSMLIGGSSISPQSSVRVRGDVPVPFVAGEDTCELLLLQGRPIGEPVVQHGPFVMSSRQEIMEAFEDYRRTGFGGWPWQSDAPVHPREEGRFAKHADGRVERGEP
jgi:redox-sensitive bicupin YhaK (pirin superfamily)